MIAEPKKRPESAEAVKKRPPVFSKCEAGQEELSFPRYNGTMEFGAALYSAR